MGLAGFGKYAKLVPNSIVVGFTVGIAITIAVANLGEALGYEQDVDGNLLNKISIILANTHEFNIYAFFLAALTFFMTRYLLKISVFIPGPLLALGTATLLPWGMRAQIAVQASLTGHLVLSTLHTNSAAGAIPRLLDMGV